MQLIVGTLHLLTIFMKCRFCVMEMVLIFKKHHAHWMVVLKFIHQELILQQQKQENF